MKKSVSVFRGVTAFLGAAVITVYAYGSPQFDSHGKVVTDNNGNKQNYSQEEALHHKSKVSKPNQVSHVAKNISPPQILFDFDNVTSNPNNVISTAPLANGIQVWRNSFSYFSFGSGIGLSGFELEDLNGDSTPEFITGGSPVGFGDNSFWSVMSYDPKTNSYGITWQSEITEGYNNTITDLEVFYLPLVQQKVVMSARKSGEVNLYLSNPLKKFSSSRLPEAINKIILGDPDNDGDVEIVLLGANKTYFYALKDLSLEGSVDYGAKDVAIGNIDDDADLELVYNNGIAISYKNGSVSIEWDYTLIGFGDKVRLADIDGDQREEIIGANRWYDLYIFDAENYALKWSAKTDNDIDVLQTFDIDDDGVYEVVYGDGQWGDIHVLRGIDGERTQTISNPEHGVTDILIADIDNDGSKEIVWGAGASSTGSDHLFVHDLKSLALEYKSQHVDPPFTSLALGDVDNDSKDEFVFSSFKSNSGYDDGVVFIYDAETLTMEWNATGLINDAAWGDINDIKIADLNNDGLNELIVAGSKYYNGEILVVDVENKLVSQRFNLDKVQRAIEVADVDLDGDNELITLGSKVNIISASDASIEWSSIDFNSSSKIYDLKVANIDSDKAPEIIINRGNIHVIDGVTHSPFYSSASTYNTLSLLPGNKSDDQFQIYAGKENGSVDVLGTIHPLTPDSTLSICSSNLLALTTYDDNSLLFSCDDKFGVFDVRNNLLTWTQPTLDQEVGEDGRLIYFRSTNQNLIAYSAKNRVRLWQSLSGIFE